MEHREHYSGKWPEEITELIPLDTEEKETDRKSWKQELNIAKVNMEYGHEDWMQTVKARIEETGPTVEKTCR